MGDLISRQAAIKALERDEEYNEDIPNRADGVRDAIITISSLPSAEPKVNEAGDLISREYMKSLGGACIAQRLKDGDLCPIISIDLLPSAQPERTCVNCGRTVNNGGWYADGRTRCPIEEHYALPKDGYCHLWEKRNVTDDDYPERRTE